MALSLAERFTRLTELLGQWQSVWRPLPFQHPEPPWAARFPEAVHALRALSDAACERAQQEPFTDSPLAAWLPVAALRELVDLPQYPATPTPLPNAWNAHVGGRKWQQIAAFVPAVTVAPGQSLVDWCSGKGHLARSLARWHRTPVLALERQPDLCAQGQSLADRQGVAVRLQVQDVLAPDVTRWLQGTVHVTALHACGDLHRQLLTLAAQAGCAITLAPCCYQRTTDAHYRPLSHRGRALADAHALHLDRDDLALAVQESITAPRHVRLHRNRANAWRLGFDRLQRDLRGIDAYLPVPSLAYGRLPDRFEDFCRWAAAEKGLVLPTTVDWRGRERRGWQRLDEVARLELVRHLFRRPLEVWLALDRLHVLEEAGLCVDLGIFCAREVTPRNLLLRAWPPDPSRALSAT